MWAVELVVQHVKLLHSGEWSSFICVISVNFLMGSIDKIFWLF